LIDKIRRSDSLVINIFVGRDIKGIWCGAYAPNMQVIDMGDFEKLPKESPYSQYSALVHELVEAYLAQECRQDFEQAHAFGLLNEFRIYGWRRVTDRVHFERIGGKQYEVHVFVYRDLTTGAQTTVTVRHAPDGTFTIEVKPRQIMR
jgi:hypothetical protein